MISYFDLMILMKTKKQPNKVAIMLKKNDWLNEYIFEFDKKRKNYVLVQKQKEDKLYYRGIDPLLFFNIKESKIHDNIIRVLEPYSFKIGEYCSYFDLLNSIKFNNQPYHIRFHFNDLYQDYYFEKAGDIEEYQVLNPLDGTLKKYYFSLFDQCSKYDMFENNIEVISK